MFTIFYSANSQVLHKFIFFIFDSVAETGAGASSRRIILLTPHRYLAWTQKSLKFLKQFSIFLVHITTQTSNQKKAKLFYNKFQFLFFFKNDRAL
jgi:hypothetical protein